MCLAACFACMLCIGASTYYVIDAIEMFFEEVTASTAVQNEQCIVIL
jgi:hypothetical protein